MSTRAGRRTTLSGLIPARQETGPPGGERAQGYERCVTSRVTGRLKIKGEAPLPVIPILATPSWNRSDLPVPPSLKLRRASTQILAPPSLSRNTIAWDCKGAPFARPPFAEATEGKHSNLGTAKLE